jgi:hypothetical protein
MKEIDMLNSVSIRSLFLIVLFFKFLPFYSLKDYYITEQCHKGVNLKKNLNKKRGQKDKLFDPLEVIKSVDLKIILKMDLHIMQS